MVYAAPAASGEYRLGCVFALLITHLSGTILHHGSAGFKTEMYVGIAVDVILLGIGGRGDTDQYLENVTLKTHARLVVPGVMIILLVTVPCLFGMNENTLVSISRYHAFRGVRYDYTSSK